MNAPLFVGKHSCWLAEKPDKTDPEKAVLAWDGPTLPSSHLHPKCLEKSLERNRFSECVMGDKQGTGGAEDILWEFAVSSRGRLELDHIMLA